MPKLWVHWRECPYHQHGNNGEPELTVSEELMTIYSRWFDMDNSGDGTISGVFADYIEDHTEECVGDQEAIGRVVEFLRSRFYSPDYNKQTT